MMRISDRLPLRRLKFRLWKLLSIRTLIVIAICCLLVEICRGYRLNSAKKQLAKNAEIGEIKRQVNDDAARIAPANHHVDDVVPAYHFKQSLGEKPVSAVANPLRKPNVKHWPPVNAFEQINNGRQNPIQMEAPVPELRMPKPQNDEPFYANRIIHFDLKGAAPSVSYLKKVMKLVRENGATGILLEWEDTFPFTGILDENRSSDAYTMEEVKDLLGTATSLGLTVIPLVQTFGHLEWILKLEKFRKYRENDLYPQVVCLADDEGVELVKEAIRQVVSAHLPFGIQNFHIGADEAFQYGVCMKDREWFGEHPGTSSEDLAANHLRKIAEFVQSLVPAVRIMAWYDMVKTFKPQVVHANNLHNLLEVVVWDYSETLQQQNEMTWRMLAESFPIVWGSSAYKGANEPSSQLLDLRHYVQNTKEWGTHRQLYGKFFTSFRGLILAGWQRYDHFAVLCEILPVGLPSAIVNLMIATAGKHVNEMEISRKAATILNCSSVEIDEPSTFSRCQFPGSQIVTQIHAFLTVRLRMVDEALGTNEMKGWLSAFNLRHNYTQHWYLQQLQETLQVQYSGVLEAEQTIRSAMGSIFRPNTIDEWMFEYLDPTLDKLSNLLQQVRRLNQHKVFPVRSFPIKRAERVEL